MKPIRYKNISIVFFCLIIFTGCSIKDTIKSESDEDGLRERMMTYYSHRVKEDFDKSYAFEDPLSRGMLKLSQYIQKLSASPVKWEAIKIQDFRIKNDKATVNLTARVKVRIINTAAKAAKVMEHDALIEEMWLKSGGEWYHAFQ